MRLTIVARYCVASFFILYLASVSGDVVSNPDCANSVISPTDPGYGYFDVYLDGPTHMCAGSTHEFVASGGGDCDVRSDSGCSPACSPVGKCGVDIKNTDVVFNWTTTGAISGFPATGSLNEMKKFEASSTNWGAAYTVTVSREEATWFEEGSLHSATISGIVDEPNQVAYTTAAHVDTQGPPDAVAMSIVATIKLIFDADGPSASDDSHCCHGIKISGSSATFGATGDHGEDLDSSGKLTAAWGIGYNIKWFNYIRICGSQTGQFDGCSDTGTARRNILIVDGGALAHEFGHTEAGLADRSSGDSTNIMWYQNTGGGNLTAAQCSSF